MNRPHADLSNTIFPADLAELIVSNPPDIQLRIFNTLTQERAADLFGYLPVRVQKQLISSLAHEKVAALLDALPPDDRTALLEELPGDLVNQLLKYLSPGERALSIKLLGYREDSVGRLMTPDYIAIKMNWKVSEVLEHIRQTGKDSETINVIYAVDDQGVLIDDFRIRQFLLAPLSAKVEDLSDRKFVALDVNETQERAIEIFRKYGRFALPVIDSKGIMLGIVTFDDILRVATERDTEDIHKVGGVSDLKETYMGVPLFYLIKKRALWLIILFVGELFTATAMGFFQDEIAKAVVLALFLPLIISSGGNAGSQASTLIIRALALGEVALKDWWKIMCREIFSGLLLGLILAVIGFFRVSAWGAVSHIYGEHWLILACTIFLALIGVVLWGTLVGAMLPLILRRCGFDPAVSSTPFVATFVDVTGLIIYFSIALFVLHGTLL